MIWTAKFTIRFKKLVIVLPLSTDPVLRKNIDRPNFEGKKGVFFSNMTKLHSEKSDHAPLTESL